MFPLYVNLLQQKVNTYFLPFKKNALDITVFGSNDLWIYYFSLKSNFKATLTVHLLYCVPERPKQNSPVVLCNIPELS